MKSRASMFFMSEGKNRRSSKVKRFSEILFHTPCGLCIFIFPLNLMQSLHKSVESMGADKVFSSLLQGPFA